MTGGIHACGNDRMNGRLYVVGIGPGGPEHMTPAARAALDTAGTVVGYKTYIDLVRPFLDGKTVVASGMRGEVDRCRDALRLAQEGETVALVSSGDAGIYGMAGLVLELRDGMTPQVEIVPGVSAVQMAAARLGAPLMHDFAVISLSDLLTPWPIIRRRLDAAGRADFVVALYNPKSHGRTTQIEEAREILLRRRDPATPVGIVRHAGREGEEVRISDLGSFTKEEIDMFCVVVVGNSATRVKDGRILTPRGYGDKYLSGTKMEGPIRGKGTLFVGGTGSDVGKSIVTAGLCRIFRRRGWSVAPFKAQNMALNSAVTPEGGEIGRAQALQAAACGLEPHVDMNPVLLKPNSETGSQVIVHGRPVRNMTVAEYHRFKPEAFAAVKASFERLRARHDVVVLEGAGSIAEINLRAHDITNLKAAAMAEAPVILVADIDRGGVFASIAGTIDLLTFEERRSVAGVIINKFRGDPSLLDSGIAEVEERTGVPVLGVVPWIRLRLPEEDSVALARKGGARSDAALRVGVVRLPRISNYTDFDPLEHEPGVALRYIEDPAEVSELDLLILPGTKSTIADLAWLFETGLAGAIRSFHAAGGRIVGICGGYQMLGERVLDPDGIESDVSEAPGLGLLAAETRMEALKKTRQAEGILLGGAEGWGLAAGTPVSGYEIHQGETLLKGACRPFLRLTRWGEDASIDDGAISADGKVIGTYLHGFFDLPELRRAIIGPLLPAGPLPAGGDETTLNGELDRLADHLEEHLDVDRILELTLPEGEGA